MDSQQHELIQQVCKRPGMYVSPGSIDNVLAYLTGLDTATGCLTGFREWLLPRFDDGNNLTWPGVVKMLLDSEQVADHDAVSRLGELMAEFFAFSNENNATCCGLTRVFLRYHAWLLNRSWYHSGSLGYIAPYDGIKVPGPVQKAPNSG